MENTPLQAMIIDDEPYAREDLKAMLIPHPEINVLCEAGTISKAKELLEEKQLDVVFLDIQLRGGSGFDLVPFIDPKVNIIFITAHDEYAIRAFEVNALDYLLKPVNTERLVKAIERTHKKKDPPAQPSFKSDDSILIKTDHGQIFVRLDKIVSVFSLGGNYTTLTVDGEEKLTVRKTMKAWEELLPETTFLRIHRSSIINTHIIERIYKDSSGSYQIVLQNQEEEFQVSRRMAPRLKDLIESRPT